VLLHLIRHGESVNNAGPARVPDAPLTPEGRAQAEALARAWPAVVPGWLPGSHEPLEAVITSPLWRALETAEALARATGAPVVGWPELVEWNRSFPWDGHQAAEVRARFPQVVFDPALEEVGWPAYPGEERPDEVEARAARVAERVARELGGRRHVALVGHQGFHGQLLRRWLRAGRPQLAFRQGNCRVHTLEWDAERIMVVQLNAPGVPPGPGAPPPLRAVGDALEVFLLRHGQSLGNQTGERIYDPPLTELGRRQAERAADLLAALQPTHVVSSPMVRALETAVPLAERVRLPVTVWPDLVEYNHWDAYGTLPRAELVRRFPRAVLPGGFPEEGVRYEGPEPEASAWRRARGVVGRLAALPRPARVAVVTHGTFAGVLLRVALGIAPGAPVGFYQDNAGVSHLAWDGERLLVLAVNLTVHLGGA
jgi:broad specificity phosphatase PhoE